MREIPKLIPDVDLLLDLEPEELGAKMLFALRSRPGDQLGGQQGTFHPSNLLGEIWNDRGQSGYQRDNRSGDVELAIFEAWAWLEAQGLVIAPPGTNGQNGWRKLSRRARKFADEAEFANYAVARRLPKESLHGSIRDRVWASFMRGDFDGAVFHATKMVEVAVSEATAITKELGVDLMRAAFKPATGPLTDTASPKAEQERLMELFTGAIGTFKNPQSHRLVDLDDPQEAMEIIMLANNLLRIVDRRVAAKGKPA